MGAVLLQVSTTQKTACDKTKSLSPHILSLYQTDLNIEIKNGGCLLMYKYNCVCVQFRPQMK